MRSILLSALLLAAASVLGSDLSQTDVAAVRKTLDRYVAAWLAGDAETVMRQLTADSVLIPGDKVPNVGADAIRKYWWPANTPKFTLHRFATTTDEITGSADWAVVRGSQVIEWTSGRERWRTHGNYIAVLHKTKDGWRIATQMAANSPNERVP